MPRYASRTQDEVVSSSSPGWSYAIIILGANPPRPLLRRRPHCCIRRTAACDGIVVGASGGVFVVVAIVVVARIPSGNGYGNEIEKRRGLGRSHRPSRRPSAVAVSPGPGEHSGTTHDKRLRADAPAPMGVVPRGRHIGGDARAQPSTDGAVAILPPRGGIEGQVMRSECGIGRVEQGGGGGDGEISQVDAHSGLVGRDMREEGRRRRYWGGGRRMGHERSDGHGTRGLRSVLLRRAEPVPVAALARDWNEVDDGGRELRRALRRRGRLQDGRGVHRRHDMVWHADENAVAAGEENGIGRRADEGGLRKWHWHHEVSNSLSGSNMIHPLIIYYLSSSEI